MVLGSDPEDFSWGGSYPWEVLISSLFAASSERSFGV